MPLLSTALRYFLAVARARSISGAADAVHVVPSAISRQIQRLEESVGCPLFDRRSRGVVLTTAGEQLFRWGTRTQQAADTLVQDLQRVGSPSTLTVRVACTEAFATGFMATVMSAFRSRHPAALIQLVVGKSGEVTRWLQRGEVDCGLKFGLDIEADLHLIHIDPAPIRAVVSATHPLTARDDLRLEQLVSHPLGLPSPESETTIRSILNTACAAQNLSYQAMYSGNITTLLSLAAQGETVVLTSDLAIRSCVRDGRLQALRVAHPLFESRRVMLMRPPGPQPSMLTRSFIDHLTDELLTYSPRPQRSDRRNAPNRRQAERRS